MDSETDGSSPTVPESARDTVRSTAPMSPFEPTDAGIGFLVLVFGLFVTFVLPVLIAV